MKHSTISLRNGLLATDLSRDSLRAARWSRFLRARYCSKVSIVYVVDVFPIPRGTEFDKRKQDAAKQLLRYTRSARLDDKGCKSIVLIGDPPGAVQRLIKESKADLVVLGSASEGVQRLFRGSISEEIFRSARCPVLTIGPKAHNPPTAGSFRNLLFATDLRKSSFSALPYIHYLLRSDRGARVTLVHFSALLRSSIFESYSTRKRLKASLMGLLSADVKRQIRDVVVENYSPAEGVLELAAGLDVELIVLGIRPGGTFLRAETHSSPSITRQIIMSAICPVLTVRG